MTAKKNNENLHTLLDKLGVLPKGAPASVVYRL